MKNKFISLYADLFAALGSEPRLRIMQLLFTAYPEGMVVGEIQARLKIPNSTLSHHLEKLRVEKLVEVKKDKQYLWYAANAETMEDLLAFLYTGNSPADRNFTKSEEASLFHDGVFMNESAKNSSTKEKFMFEGFFRPIWNKLFKRIRFSIPRFVIRFTPKAMSVIKLAQNEANRLGLNYVGTEQLLAGLVAEESGRAWQFLTEAGITLEKVQTEIERILADYLQANNSVISFPKEIIFTPRAEKIIEIADRQSVELGRDYIGTEHLLLGMLEEAEGLGCKILQNLNIDTNSLKNKLQDSLC